MEYKYYVTFSFTVPAYNSRPLRLNNGHRFIERDSPLDNSDTLQELRRSIEDEGLMDVTLLDWKRIN